MYTSDLSSEIDVEDLAMGKAARQADRFQQNV